MKLFKRDRVYIVPNWFGAMYSGGIIASLITAATYSNNLVYSLSFFLVGLFLIGMIQANNNLKQLQIDRIEFAIAEEQSSGIGSIWFKNQGKEDKYYIKVELPEIGKDFNFFVEQVDKRSTGQQSFEYPTQKAGVYPIHKVRVSSVFPFGIFYTWKVFELKKELVIYPRPEGVPELPKTTRRGESHHHQMGLGGEDYSEHKKYQEGEPVQHVDWKAFARGRGMLTKKFKDGDSENILLNFPNKEKLEIDDLRQLSKWIHICRDSMHTYSVDKKEKQLLGMGMGVEHSYRALSILAREAKDVDN